MRAESLAVYGVDLYPIGPRPRTGPTSSRPSSTSCSWPARAQPASPPGASSHELGTAVDVATPEMRDMIDQIGASFGWAKVEAPDRVVARQLRGRLIPVPRRQTLGQAVDVAGPERQQHVALP